MYLADTDVGSDVTIEGEIERKFNTHWSAIQILDIRITSHPNSDLVGELEKFYFCANNRCVKKYSRYFDNIVVAELGEGIMGSGPYTNLIRGEKLRFNAINMIFRSWAYSGISSLSRIGGPADVDNNSRVTHEDYVIFMENYDKAIKNTFHNSAKPCDVDSNFRIYTTDRTLLVAALAERSEEQQLVKLSLSDKYGTSSRLASYYVDINGDMFLNQDDLEHFDKNCGL